MRVVIEAIPSTPTTIAPVTLVVTLVCIVKNMKELGCEPFLSEPNAVIAVRWLHIVKYILDQIHVTKDLWVNYATHLLSDRARSW